MTDNEWGADFANADERRGAAITVERGGLAAMRAIRAKPSHRPESR